jgi:hypothetical protein
VTSHDAGPPICSVRPTGDVVGAVFPSPRDPPGGRSPITRCQDLRPGKCCAARTIRWEQRQAVLSGRPLRLAIARDSILLCAALAALGVHLGHAAAPAPYKLPDRGPAVHAPTPRLTARGLSADLSSCLHSVSSRRQTQASKIVIASEALDPAACNLAPPWNTVTREATCRRC